MPTAPLPTDAREFDLAQTPLQPGTTIIEASAGTGKTFTLAGLYLRLLLECGLKVDQILVVTYTVAATGELRDRIRRLLAQAHVALQTLRAGSPLPADTPAYLADLLAPYAGRAAVLAEELATALSAFDQAAIQTIHGFCQRALRDRAFESASLFDIEMLADLSALNAQAAEDFWRREVLRAGPVALGLAVAEFKTPAGLLSELASLLRLPELVTLPAAPSMEEAAAAAVTAAHQRLREHWQQEAPQIRAQFGDGAKWVNDPYNNTLKVTPWLTAVDAALTQPVVAPDDLEALLQFTTEKIEKKRSKKWKLPPPRLPFFELCDTFEVAAKQWRMTLASAALNYLRAELPALKSRLKVQSFDDLLTRLDVALRGPGGGALASALRSQYHAALIDEFQDTDPLQFRIFQRVFQQPAADGRLPFLYLIGDPKQAIYAFRGADLQTYLHAQRGATQRYTLTRNYRSAPRLIEAVNQVFRANPAAFLSPDMPFRDAHAAAAASGEELTLAGAASPPLQLWFEPGGDKDQTVGQADQELPEAVATEIVRLLSDGARLGDRLLRPEDIAVLVRTNSQARRVQSALAARNVPSVLHSTASLFESEEVGEMRRLLAAMDAPGDDGLLRSVLTTTALGCDASQLQSAMENDAAWQGLGGAFCELSHWWSRKGLLPAFRALVQRFGVRARLLALADGERRLTNLLHLAEVLHDATHEFNLSRTGLRAWLDEQARQPTGGDAHQLRLESDERAVCLATIHRSKGLEYGVVFCPFSWKGVRKKRGQCPALFHQIDADGQPQRVFDFGSADFAAHLALAEEEQLAEEVRLLYVALTRAKHRCHLVWGRFSQAGTSALAWLLHPPPPGTGRLDALEAHWSVLKDGLLRTQVEALATRASGTVQVVDIPPATEARFRPPAEPPRTTAAREFTAQIQRDWRLSSFSSLTAARHHEQPDHDAQLYEPRVEVPAAGIFAFPHGARAGTCLHKLFEELDFTEAGTPATRQLIAATLRDHNLGAHWSREVERMLEHVLHAPLPSLAGVRLAEIPWERRLNEMEFSFPIGRLDPASLHACLARHANTGAEPLRLAFEPVTGLIKGFVDLLFEADGRFYLVDWKSNWLGNRPQDYCPAAMAEEMRRRAYDLQYRLYTVALDKYLRARLPGYAFERHFGGVFYVFLRGVDPAHPDCGIYHDRPTAEFVRDFAELLAPASAN